MVYDAIVVGSGVAGLTAAAYLTKIYGLKTLVCEKEKTIGGLVQSFERDGFVFDGGIRALENAGVLFPMLRQLELEIELVKNHISLGIEDQIIQIESDSSVNDYQDLLINLYPESKADIENLTRAIKSIMGYMDVQYGIDNPLFLDMKKDRDYMIREVVPWIFKYMVTVPKINKVNKPVLEYLENFTDDQALLDIVAQHFFTDTPAFFALSYITLFLDYFYPVGGTGVLPQKLSDLIKENSGELRTNTQIASINVDNHTLIDAKNISYQFKNLIWCADLKTLYQTIDLDSISDLKIKKLVEKQRTLLSDKKGNNSIFTLYASVDKDRSYFSNIATEHFFYTPTRKGQSSAGELPIGQTWEKIKVWLSNFFASTTYEISIPVLRDSSLAPVDKTGLIISVLFDFRLTKYIEELGYYQEFKEFCENRILETLDKTIYPGISNALINKFSSTPITILNTTGNTDGAITGWSFTNHPIPTESRLPKINNAVKTKIPGIFQAGQWTYSPSGFPIALITGKLAADNLAAYAKRHKIK